jgi:RNA polymerase sigma-54 factor
MKPALQLKLSQHLALTPQLQQSIKLLQLSTIEMQQEIERYLLENPMLEREDDTPESFAGAQQFDSPRNEETRSEGSEEREPREERDSEPPASPSEVDDDRWTSDAGTFTGAGRDDDDDSDAQDIHAANVSLREHLGWQLGMTQLTERDRSLVRFLIEALDDDGYLSAPAGTVGNPAAGIRNRARRAGNRPAPYPELRSDRHRRPQPAGMPGLQLRALPDEHDRNVALLIVDKHLELLAARDLPSCAGSPVTMTKTSRRHRPDHQPESAPGSRLCPGRSPLHHA